MSLCCPGADVRDLKDLLQCSACGTAYRRHMPESSELDSSYASMWQPTAHRPEGCYTAAAETIMGMCSPSTVYEVGGHEIGSLVSPKAESGWLEKNRTFDLVIAAHVLEHMRDPVEALDSLFGMVNPEGYLYIEVPSISGPHLYFNLSRWHLWHFSTRWPHIYKRPVLGSGEHGPRGWPSQWWLLGGEPEHVSLAVQILHTKVRVARAAATLRRFQGTPVLGACEALERACEMGRYWPEVVLDTYKREFLGRPTRLPEDVLPCERVLLAPMCPMSRAALRAEIQAKYPGQNMIDLYE